MIKLTIKIPAYGANTQSPSHTFVINKESVQWLNEKGEVTKQAGIDPNEGIMDIVGKVGFDIPYACRAGACFSCACKVKGGMDKLDQEKYGTKLIDTPEDEFLTCIGGIKDEYLSDEKEHIVEVELLS